MLYLVARLIPGILALATTALLTRALSPGDYGIYGLTLIIMSFGSTIAFDWLGLSFMRFYNARQDDAGTIPTFITLYYGMVGLTAVGLAAALGLGFLPVDDAPLVCVGFCMAWLFALFELLSRFEVAAFQPVRYLTMNLARAVILLTCTIGAAWLTRDPVWTAVGNATGLGLAIALLGRRRLALRPAMFDVALARQVVRFGLPFALSMLLAGLFTSGVRSLVAAMTSGRDLGLYTAAYVISQNVLAVIAAAIGSITFPLAVRAFERGNPPMLEAQLKQNFALLLGAMAPACLGIALTAHDMAAQLVGADFRDGVAQLMPWMALTVLLGSTRGVYLDHAFQLGKRSAHQVAVSAGAAVLALAGTALLVPALGTVGGPIATSIAMTVSCVHAYVAGRSSQPMPVPLGVLAQVGCASAVMTVAVIAVPSGEPYSLYVKILVGMASYAAVCVAVDLLGLRVSALQLVSSGADRVRRRHAG